MRKSNPNNDDNKPMTGEDYLNFTKSLLGEGNSNQPDNNRGQDSNTPQGEPKSYQDQVNELLKQVTVDEDGKFIYPDGTPEHLKYAVAAEKKFRDTQAGFTKTRQALRELEAEKEALREQLANLSTSGVGIPEEKLEELDELKFTDPDKWFKEKLKLEQEYQTEARQKIEQQLEEVGKKAKAQSELENRKQVLSEFNKNHGLELTPEYLAERVPPFIGKRLEVGEIDFETYLSEAVKFIEAPKKVNNEPAPGVTDLTKGGGDATGNINTKPDDTVIDYNQVVF